MNTPTIKNLTHHSLLVKHSPDSKIAAMIDTAHNALNDYQKALVKDVTKNDIQRKLSLLKHSTQQIESILKTVDLESKSVDGKVEEYNERVDSALEVKGTTDLLI